MQDKETVLNQTSLETEDRDELQRILAEATLNSEIIGTISKIYWLI